MTIATQVSNRLRRTGIWYLSAKILIALLIISASGMITVTTTTNQAEVGGSLNVTNLLIAVDKGFSTASSVSSAIGTSCSNAPVFGAGTVAQTMIASQHIVYDLAVNETLSTTLNQCFKATLVVTPSGGSTTTYGPVYLNSTVSVPLVAEIDCKFDIGSSIPASPWSFQLTVQ